MPSRVALTLVLLAVLLAGCVRADDVEPIASDATEGGGSEEATTAEEESEEESEAPGDGGGGGGRLTIATGGTGGVYFVYGGGIANEITTNLEGYEATAQVTSASVDNAFLVADGDADVAFALADTAADAVNGEGEFGEALELQALANVYRNVNHLVTTAGTGIQTVEDLRGRSVSVGSPGSGTEVTALRVLAAAGLDADADITREQLGVAESVQAVRDGTVEAFFWSGGLPTSAVSDLASTDDVVLVPLDAQLDAMVEQYGEVYEEITVPAGTYTGVDEEVVTIGVPNYLLVSPDMDEELAYQLTSLLFDRQDALTQVHPEAGNLDLETAQEVDPLELHPGAQRYYDEAR